jgi:hypothetical protein
MNQTAKGHFLLLEFPNVLSGLLSNPRTAWMIGHTSQVNTTRTDLKEEENAQSLQEQGFDG